MMRTNYNIKFNPDIKKIEHDIVQSLINSQFFVGEKESTTQIISYFITRKELTQKKLKELTSLSKGLISQELNALLKRGIIEEKQAMQNKSKIKIYTMNSIKKGFIKSYLSAVKDYLKYKDQFHRIKSELDQKREVFRKFDEYEALMGLVDLFLKSMPLTESIISMLKKKIEIDD
ncbi:MAG: hypothetical protein BAJALOKI1v1_660015 [Promethearchaeota archaeon]|nr:MAG: hypothetical protein BAJALOKI1v1_660015 [Candidatus Lokiarchaeota archaeon]